MVLCSVECVQRVSEYLGVSTKKTHVSENNIVASNDLLKNRTVEGFSTILQALAKNSKRYSLLGNDDITKALVLQWLEYATLYINYADSAENAKKILKEINTALYDKSYITSSNKTLADIVLYHSLHSIMNGLTNQEKAEYINVSRWFDNLQQEEKLRRELNYVNFDLMHLYI